MRWLETLDVLRAFAAARRLDRIADPAELRRVQAQGLARLRRRVMPRSPFYAPLAGEPFDAWPIMDKARWMADFDRINTVGVRLADALAAAERAEATRDFAPTLNGVAVGLSTGTSDRRGVFLVSPAERRRWAGTMMAKLLPVRPLKPRTVAFFLRADSRLYSDVERSGRIRFRFFDLLEPIEAQAARLDQLQPDLLVAPPSALRVLAELQASGPLQIAPERVVSVAEVLHADDRAAITSAFGRDLAEVYQATEGSLAATCERGTLHLNEAQVLFEREPLGEGRFTPVVTDLARESQPVIRYRLDDVLVEGDPCPCGRASATLVAIEGRSDDVLDLAAAGGGVRVFPDFVARAVLGAAPEIADFRVRQTSPRALQVRLCAPETVQPAVASALRALAQRLGAEPPEVSFAPWAPDRGPKRRRVTRDVSFAR